MSQIDRAFVILKYGEPIRNVYTDELVSITYYNRLPDSVKDYLRQSGIEDFKTSPEQLIEALIDYENRISEINDRT